MARIELWFVTWRVVSPRFGQEPVAIIRLMAKVRFRRADGSETEPWEAILDTGAPFGVLPRRLWRDLDTAIRVQETTFGGISQRKVCQIRASFGLVRGQLEDETGSMSQWCEFPVFLAQTDRVPLILGFAGLWEKFKTYFDYAADVAWVEERPD